ncbi:MAG: dephospho-CoA kinase [Proteobacteria bacterium]|nr:dephospho-CoA kinase [Pseudomonadota bacterium]
MDVWGLTGNIACGKSAVEAMLRERGIPVLDLDQVAREVVEPGEPALDEIRDAFGAGVIDADGRLDRPALGAIIFSDPDARARLQAITWPRIYQRTAEKLAAMEAPVAVVSAAMMIESGSYQQYAGLIVVTCEPGIRLSRLLARDGLSEADALKRIDAQMAQADKAALADHVIDNSGTLAETAAQVEALIAGLRP